MLGVLPIKGLNIAFCRLRWYTVIMIPNLLTPQETATLLADRFKALRLEAGFKRSTLATQAGVSESSLKRFETSGQVSLQNLLRLAHALGRLEDFADLFTPPPATTLAGLRQQSVAKDRKRGIR